MALYENMNNAENRIRVKTGWRDAVVVGTEPTIGAMIDLFRGQSQKKGAPVVVAFDGWYGVEWGEIVASIREAADRAGMKIQFQHINTVFKPIDYINQYKKTYVTDDPGFGYVNSGGHIQDLMDAAKVQNLKATMEGVRQQNSSSPSAFAVFGSGAAISELNDAYDLKFYFDMTNQPTLWKMWDGGLIPFGHDAAEKGYHWKEFAYCDFYLLHRQKKYAFEQMDFYVEAIRPEDLKLVPREAYDGIIAAAVEYPIKQVKIYQPGPWGAYRYRDLWEIPGLECNAWNELSGPELSFILELGQGKALNMPMPNLMQHAQKFVGPYINQTYPDLIPLQAWLDDGYFPTPTPPERTAMPIHNHPGSDYVKRHFNEPLGRYETYYIAEAYEGANTWMGYRDDVDLELWERKCRESDKSKTVIEDWKDFICNWPTNVGDLFLIPPGTTHGHGGNQMVLEMDTTPSVSGTEYSFFLYDFLRPSWDDRTKTMTGKPMKMHLEHGFDNEQWRREKWVQEHLRPRARIVKWTKEYSIDRYDSYGSMPFEIERFHFYKVAQNDTEGKFMHIVTLTFGDRVKIRSKTNPGLECEIDRFQAAMVPACFGAYEFINLKEGFCTVVQMRWKKG